MDAFASIFAVKDGGKQSSLLSKALLFKYLGWTPTGGECADRKRPLDLSRDIRDIDAVQSLIRMNLALE